MLNRIKNWNYKNINISQNNIVTLAMVLSIMALVMSIPSSSNCASADSCTVSSTGTFTGNMAIKSGTNYTLTQQHTFSQNVIANWQDVGGTHTGTVIMKDSAGDMNLNGGLKLGTSATSTSGTIRWNGTAVQYVNAGGVWGDIDTTASPSNSFGVVDTTSGSVTAGSTGDTVTIVGSGGITTSATGSTVTIAAGGGSSPAEFYAYVSSSYTAASSGRYRADTELYDTQNYFTLGSSPNYLITYTDETTRVFKFDYLASQGDGRIDLGVKGNQTLSIGIKRFENNTAAFGLFSNNLSGVICLNQNDTIQMEIYNGSSTVEGGFDFGHFMMSELIGLGSPSCTNGGFD